MNILKEIVKNKKRELNIFQSNKNLFKKTFENKNAKIIGEIKLKSPNNLNIDINNLENIQKFYKENKEIKAISILIDEKYFSWDIKRAIYFKENSKKLTFFKEFVIGKKQIDWASYYWYDGLLLIKKILKNHELIEFIKYSNSKNIYPIVEVDNENDFKKILDLREKYDFWIALNSRNLTTMKINKDLHFKIFEKYKENLWDKIIFAFSGIEYENIKNYKNKFNWVLIWTHFMKNFTN
jgi:indole-3-glycerol phosphate synthase